MLISRSFYTLHALSLQFSSLMFKTFLKLLKLLNSSCEVQCLYFQVCKATLLDFVASSTCLQFLERSDQSISFVSFSSFFSSLFSLESYVSCKSDDRSFLNYCFLVIASSLATLIHDDVLNVKCVFSCVCSCLLRSWMNVFNFCTFFAMNMSWLSIFLSEMFWRRWISFKITSFHE